MANGFVKDYGGLAAVRWFLGVTEVSAEPSGLCRGVTDNVSDPKAGLFPGVK